MRLNTYEVDIIALDSKHNEVVFIEVKRRRNSKYGFPEQAVSYKKRSNMHRVAQAYLQNHSFPLDYRFDIIAIVGNRVEHFKNITWLT